MKISHYLTVCVLTLGLAGLMPVRAEADRTSEGDKKCTMCHDESWRTPVLTIYQTKHGVKGDSRTPGCQGCHGESAKHQEDPGANAPEVVFSAKSKKLSSVDARNTACLSCHESRIRPKALWAGSTHETHGLACTDCHESHNANQKVMSKLTQPERGIRDLPAILGTIGAAGQVLRDRCTLRLTLPELVHCGQRCSHPTTLHSFTSTADCPAERRGRIDTTGQLLSQSLTAPQDPRFYGSQ